MSKISLAYRICGFLYLNRDELYNLDINLQQRQLG